MELTDLRSNQLLPPGGSPQGETTQLGLGGTLGGRPLCCANVTETRVIRADTTSSMKPPVFIKPPSNANVLKTVTKITCTSFASRHAVCWERDYWKLRFRAASIREGDLSGPIRLAMGRQPG